MADASEGYAIVPDRVGASVVAVGDLTNRLDAGEDLEDAITNAGMDSVNDRDPAALAAHLDRVRALNLTGDSRAYWDSAD